MIIKDLVIENGCWKEGRNKLLVIDKKRVATFNTGRSEWKISWFNKRVWVFSKENGTFIKRNFKIILYFINFVGKVFRIEICD
jgi:hypothetical protein